MRSLTRLITGRCGDLFTMEFLQRALIDLAGFRVDWTIDNEEVKLIVGTMGRFPMFRNTG